VENLRERIFLALVAGFPTRQKSPSVSEPERIRETKLFVDYVFNMPSSLINVRPEVLSALYFLQKFTGRPSLLFQLAEIFLEVNRKNNHPIPDWV
jgi:hypothetical protein